jgi:hypothetical protein
MLNLPGGQFNTFQFNEHVGYVAVVAKYLRRSPEFTDGTNKYTRKAIFSSDGVYPSYARGNKKYQKR